MPNYRAVLPFGGVASKSATLQDPTAGWRLTATPSTATFTRLGIIGANGDITGGINARGHQQLE